MVAHWPAGIAKNIQTDAITMNIDLLPTVAEVINITPAAKAIDGRSLLPLLQGANQSPYNYLYYFNNEDIVGIPCSRTPQIKLFPNNKPPPKRGYKRLLLVNYFIYRTLLSDEPPKCADEAEF